MIEPENFNCLCMWDFVFFILENYSFSYLQLIWRHKICYVLPSSIHSQNSFISLKLPLKMPKFGIPFCRRRYPTNWELARFLMLLVYFSVDKFFPKIFEWPTNSNFWYHFQGASLESNFFGQVNKRCALRWRWWSLRVAICYCSSSTTPTSTWPNQIL